MAKASDNKFPYVHLVPAAAPAAPAAGSQRLYLDSADSNKLKRVDSAGTVTTIEGAGGGGGGTTKLPLEPATPLDGFTGASLGAAWNLAGSYVAGDFTVGDSWVACPVGRAAGSYVWRTPPGSWSVITAKLSAVVASNGPAVGIIAVDNTGAGVGAAAAYAGAPDALIAGVLAAGVYASGVQSQAATKGSLVVQGLPHWLRLRKSGTNWYASASLNGVNWAPETPAVSNAATITRIGFGSWQTVSGSAPNSFGLDWFHIA